MREKIRAQKGVIQPALLIAIISSVILVSGVISGGVLIKQGRLKLTASISKPVEQKQTISLSQATEAPTKERLESEVLESEQIAPPSNSSAQPTVIPSSSPWPLPRPPSAPLPLSPLLSPPPSPLPQSLLPSPTQQTQSSQQTQQITENTEKQGLVFKVEKVIDGDTIRLENGEVVRYIGIDTPEPVHPSKPVQCFGKEASDKNRELVEGKIARLEKDITERDKYSRLLRYVWIDDLFVNDYLVRYGYAYSYTYPPDVKYSEQFVQAQKEARENNRGLWAGCVEQEVLEETPSPPAEITPPKENIICSYNAYNCSNFSTHAEAQSIFEYCGGIANDIHRLDADKDGLACESLP